MRLASHPFVQRNAHLVLPIKGASSFLFFRTPPLLAKLAVSHAEEKQFLKDIITGRLMKNPSWREMNAEREKARF